MSEELDLVPYQPTGENWLEVKKVTEPAAANALAAGLKEAQKYYDQVEEQRTNITKKILQAKYAVDEQAKPILQPLKEYIGHCKSLLTTYEWSQRQKNITAVKRKMTNVKLDPAVKQDKIAVAEAEEGAKVEGITWTRKWDFEVVSEANIPKEYMTVDAKKIIAALKAGIHVPGVRKVVTRTPSLRNRR